MKGGDDNEQSAFGGGSSSGSGAFFHRKGDGSDQQYGTEICVNASQAEEAKRRFPNARIHVLPDFPNRDMNGWTIVGGAVRPDGKIHTDAEAIKHRERLRYYRAPGE